MNAKDDHEIFKLLAKKLEVEDRFTENKSAEEWQIWMYDLPVSQLPKRALSCLTGNNSRKKVGLK